MGWPSNPFRSPLMGFDRLNQWPRLIRDLVLEFVFLFSDSIKAECPKWEKIIAQLCSVIKINASWYWHIIKPIFHPHLTYELVWDQVNVLYTNDTKHLYGSVKIDGPLTADLGRVHVALHNYIELLPPATGARVEKKKELEPCNIFMLPFKVCHLWSNFGVFYLHKLNFCHFRHLIHNHSLTKYADYFFVE